jgi:hypothetical protein
VVGANGTFLIDLDPAAQPGEQLSLVQTDPSGNASVALQYEVPLTTAPASPSDLVFAADGTSITGTAPAGSRVEVHDANGTLIGSVVANADGSFTVTLNPAQANGELLDVVAIDDSGVSSLPAQITAPDITAPAADRTGRQCRRQRGHRPCRTGQHRTRAGRRRHHCAG